MASDNRLMVTTVGSNAVAPVSRLNNNDATTPRLDFLCAVLEIDQQRKASPKEVLSFKRLKAVEGLMVEDDNNVDVENRSDEQGTARGNSPSSSELRMDSSNRSVPASCVKARPLPRPPVLPTKRVTVPTGNKRKATDHQDMRVACRTKVYLPNGKCFDMPSLSTTGAAVMDPLSPPPYLLPKRLVGIHR